MDTTEQQQLMEKFLAGKMSLPEITRFRELLHRNEGAEHWQELIAEKLKDNPEHNFAEEHLEAWYKELQTRMAVSPTAVIDSGTGKLKTLRNWGWAAAAMVIVVGAVWLFSNQQKANDTPQVAITPADIQPGKEGAVLTLADGSKVVLDSLGNGLISTQSGTKVVLKDGVVAYEPLQKDAAIAYNSIATPKGRQFSILLPDGSRAWLNAESTLRYPTAFPGNERRVEVTGEVYFEVAHNAQKPFRVNIGSGTEVEVLGTSFNVNAYANENAINTTLLEGKVRMKAEGKGELLLRPGQQARLQRNAAAGIALETEVDTDKVMAWKNGLFNFDGLGVAEVMRQLERWYDIEVVYEKEVPDIIFGGKLRKDVSLSGVLKSLQESEVHFRMEGRRLIVLP